MTEQYHDKPKHNNRTVSNYFMAETMFRIMHLMLSFPFMNTLHCTRLHLEVQLHFRKKA